MAENQNQPKEYDAVLGTQNYAPIGSVILGGLEGVKSRLRSVDIEARIAALKEALNYGEAGLDLVIQAWQHESGNFKWAAYSLLRHREEARVKQALQEYNPWLNITCLHTLQQNTLITVVAISPDGRTLVSAGRDINLWDLHTGELQPISMADFNVNSLAISQDGKTLVSRGGTYDGDHKIKVWDLQSGERKQTLEESTYRVFSLIISPDGKTLACGSENNGINVWDLQTEQITRTMSGHSHYLVQALAISSDGKTLVSGANDATIKVWNFETGKLIHTFKKHSNGAESVAISPDGQTIVSGSKDKTIKVWNLQTKQLQFTLEGHSGWVYCVAISPDGNTLVSCGRDKTIRIWDLQTGECQRILKDHTDWVYCVAISPDGNSLVSGSRDKTIKIWGIKS
ncbi:WD40 repeat domain-containing protein [Nostoc sp. 'Peltigera membranacea cyanobiont' N6]|uniref:WD40 repeat domain-containing protein n=1 Tax=Nostoc sp. 'Peltigera membranacea cyanobiont' N6 TaxID=1261031 RepID=UPI000CF3334E|nr:WD40 repeat domain-containing protein [Nostoc sp. 'Peltigera membranacea cyanobiont' N6]AVH65285.1 WD40 repeat-containing protein [Nostoc sp. 'Peltigera membranacea cyanobiont' N6]